VPKEPASKRAVAFIDGQNLFYAAKEAFGYPFPNYDVHALAARICKTQRWQLKQVRFYTGIPHVSDNRRWNAFWVAKGAAMGRQKVMVVTRPLRYRNQTVRLPNGERHTFLAAEEKGIDVRIAVDIIRLAHSRAYDVAVLFTQDQDLAEVAREIRVIAKEQQRWIKLLSAFPDGPARTNHRGVNGTDWIKIDRAAYDACIDPREFGAPKRSAKPVRRSPRKKPSPERRETRADPVPPRGRRR
jgi:uncharacterized LabA/DUF88 family protein